MSTRKTTLFYAVLLAVASAAVGMVIASRLELAPTSSAQTLAMPPMNSTPLNGTLDMATFRNIAKDQSPMVVNIRTESRARTRDLTEFFGGGGGGQPDSDLFRRFFGQPDQGQQRQRRPETVQAAGTGFIISQDGFILTNNHVVEGATKIEVKLFGAADDDRGYEAKLIGRDPLTDSALIELVEKPKEPLLPAKFGDSSLMAPVDWVMAFGIPFGLAHTVSVGVISAVGRPFTVAEARSQNMLQTDAAINPGNSGGPLLNVRGEVVGMNTAIIANQMQGNLGIGFAVPINTVRELLPQLRTGKVTRGLIGVYIQNVSADEVEEFGLKSRQGALVTTVSENGPAAKAGLEPGDVVLEFNSKPVRNRDDLVQMVVATKPGSTVPIKILRDRKERTLTITVDEVNAEAESSRQSRDSAPNETAGFGIALDNLTPEVSRRLGVPRDVDGAIVIDIDPDGPAAQARQPLEVGDVILEVNRQPVRSAAEAKRALDAVERGRSAMVLIWRQSPGGGQRIFLTIRKQ
jgi:serine protease Do